MDNNVCCIIVTFNRFNLLKEAVQAVFEQTVAVSKIIIVDNGSSDGTREWLSTIESHFVKVIFQENVGGAGGFHTGVKLAYELGFDWIWMMDDDVEPEANCLEVLLRYTDRSECLHPRKVYLDNKDHDWEGYYNVADGLQYNIGNISFKNGKEICFLNVGNFEGMLISRRIVENIGFPNSDYFIAGDDTEYGFKASLFTNVSYLRDSIIIRKKAFKEDISSIFYKYYYIRNRHLARNLITMINWGSYRSFDKMTIKIVIKMIIDELISKDQVAVKLKNLKVLLRACKDYRLKKVGNSFPK